MNRAVDEPKNSTGNGLILYHVTLFFLFARLAGILTITVAACMAYWLSFGDLAIRKDYQATTIDASPLVLFPQFGR